MSCGCGCNTCQAATERYARHAPPRASGRLRIDRAGLRKALGGRAEVLEREATKKASGRPSVNVGMVWKSYTHSLYQSGDLPVLATREALQNSADAIRSAVRARKIRAGEGRFAVTWDPSTYSLSWEDNGIGMDAATILDKFLTIGNTGKGAAVDSGEAAGGFGVAKAVILGVSQSFAWEMHTRDNLAVARGMAAEVDIFDAEPRAGTLLTVHDVSPDAYYHYDYARQEWVGLEERLAELLGANDLPELSLTFNGRPVRPLFSRRGGSRIDVHGSWGPGTTATVKAYRRTDLHGAYYVRLNGLFQFKRAARRGKLKADVVIDLHTTVRPGEAGYPLNAGRDAFREKAEDTFEELAATVEQESESVGKDHDDEVYDPDSDDPDERQGAALLGEQLAEAFDDPAVQAALSAAVGGILDFYAEKAKSQTAPEVIDSVAPAGTRPRDDGDVPERGWVLPPGLKVAAQPARLAEDLETPGEGGTARVEVPAATLDTIRTFLSQADEAAASVLGQGADRSWVGRQERGIWSPAVEVALEAMEQGAAGSEAVATVEQAIVRANEGALQPGGGGLLAVAAAAPVFAALDAAAGRPKTPRNPFAGYAGLRISKKHYDRARARRFKQNASKWVPHLLAWDGTLRLIATEARIRRVFRPGFVLDDEVNALCEQGQRGTAVLYLHPDRLAEVLRAHKERPSALAFWLHAVACHELTHLDGRMGKGHDEGFVVAREDLGRATAHLLPAISALLVRLFGLSPETCPEKRERDKLQRDLARTRESLDAHKRRVASLQRALQRCQAQAALACPGTAEASEAAAYTTPGTRVSWRTVRDWIRGWRALEGRPVSAARHAALRAHLAALPASLVEEASETELEALEEILRAVQPVRGQRAEHPTTPLLDAVDRTRTRLTRGPSSRRTAQVKDDPLDRLLADVVASVEANPPEGVASWEVSAWIQRHRVQLRVLLETELGMSP